jgi:hypothetical protein
VIDDGYAQFYADRLWQLLPAVYRTLDVGASPNANGPLREIVNRIGAQAAVVRRSIDRLWENQSIETCDDWVIPYIGDLVATRLVSSLDAVAQRIDVAKTIYYRRRAGTLGVLEEIAAGILAGSRDARTVEFFRRLARTRHQFDPPISYQIENPISGPVGFTGNSLEIAEGLIGAYSKTPMGGFADLRNGYAASNTGTAFDEYSYTADLRSPGQSLGWYNIRNLGVFLWWLQPFPISAATPVSNGANPPCFTFDPTGRDIPLFAPAQRAAEAASSAWGENWVSPAEWQLPVAIRETLWQTVLATSPANLYGISAAFWIGLMAAGTSAPVPVSTVSILPEKGRFSFPPGVPVGTITASYYFALLSPVGAGGFDYSILTAINESPNTTAVYSGAGLDNALKTVSDAATSATIQIGDSLTYAGPTQGLTVADGCTVAVQAEGGERAVLRYAKREEWAITGNASTNAAGTGTVLILQGILIQGGDLVLRGNFDAVYLRMMTLDPGTAVDGPPWFLKAIDGLPLAPTTLWIEGSVTQLTIERSITGPIRTRNGGALEQLTATDSILQSIPTHAVTTVTPMPQPITILDPASLAESLKFGSNDLAKKAVASSATLEHELKQYVPGTLLSAALMTELTAAILQFSQAQVEAAWPLAFADLALGFSAGTVCISRCTICGKTYTHRLQASESILDDVATVEDAQHGCVRFSAWATGSNLHQPYESAQIAPAAPLFESRAFGQPQYARLRSDADAAILAPASRGTIINGAQNGSEMGVYCSEMLPLKKRGLTLKFEEYAPIGQLPVWIDAD